MGKIRWAIIGVGAFSPARGAANAIAYAHAEGIKRNSDTFELVGACSLIQKNLDDFSAEYPCRTYLDMQELYQKEKPDGVTICTYAAARVQGLAEAIELSGKLKQPIELTPDGIPVVPQSHR